LDNFNIRSKTRKWGQTFDPHCNSNFIENQYRLYKKSKIEITFSKVV
jgi:hypothetical protein